MTLKDDKIPEIPLATRLFPSFLFTATFIALCIAYAAFYPSNSSTSRFFPSIPPAAATILGLIAINTAIFLAWRLPPFWAFLNRYAISVPAYPYALSMLGSAFSHQSATHLLMNMVMLWIFGTRLHDDIGRTNFLALYLSSGVFSSYFSLASSVLRGSLYTTSLGASGAVLSLLSAYCILHPSANFIPFFLPEPTADSYLDYSVSSKMMLAIVFGVEILGILRGWRRVDHWAHLGGYIGGIAWATSLQKVYRDKRRKVEEQRRKGFLGRVFNGPDRS
jgi:rhomboid-like protein